MFAERERGDKRETEREREKGIDIHADGYV